MLVGEGIVGAATVFPQDEIMIATARSKKGCFFMFSRLYKGVGKDEYSTTKLAGQLPEMEMYTLHGHKLRFLLVGKRNL